MESFNGISRQNQKNIKSENPKNSKELSENKPQAERTEIKDENNDQNENYSLLKDAEKKESNEMKKEKSGFVKSISNFLASITNSIKSLFSKIFE